MCAFFQADISSLLPFGHFPVLLSPRMVVFLSNQNGRKHFGKSTDSCSEVLLMFVPQIYLLCSLSGQKSSCHIIIHTKSQNMWIYSFQGKYCKKNKTKNKTIIIKIPHVCFLDSFQSYLKIRNHILHFFPLFDKTQAITVAQLEFSLYNIFTYPLLTLWNE